MAKDKALSTNDEVQRSKEFQSRIEMKEKVLETIREVLQSTTESVFNDSNFKTKEGNAGEYGDGTTYGAGTEANKLNIKLAGKTNISVQKQMVLGTKPLNSQVNIAYGDNFVTIEYKSPEAMFGRGVDANGDTYMINEKFILPTSNMSEFKKELEKSFTIFAKKELAYLFSTKIGVDDTTEKSTTSVVESFKQESSMKKLTIKELFSEGEQIEDKKKNFVDLDKTNPPIKGGGDKKLYFDEEKNEKLKKEVTTSGPAISGSPGGFKDGAPSGAGGYNTKYAWKKTPYGKSKTEKRPTITKDWKVVPENDKIEVAQKADSKGTGVVGQKDKNNSNSSTGNSNWKDANQTKAPKSDNDGFWTEIQLEPGTGYIPKGMKQNYIAGMHDASNGDLKKKGYAEGSKPEGEILSESAVHKPAKINENKKLDLTRKKFFSIQENEEKGINKRYLITEKTTEEYEKERWKKLSSFKLYESIKEAEEMNEFFDLIKQENIEPIINPVTIKKLTENVSHDDIFNELSKPELLSESTNIDDEETVTVEKPNSKFGLEYRFFKKDFLNENKHYILDLNSKVYVKNPNCK